MISARRPWAGRQFVSRLDRKSYPNLVSDNCIVQTEEAVPHVPLQYDDLSQLSWGCLTVTSHTSIVQVSLILHAAKQLVAMQPHKYHLLSSSIPGS